MNSIGLCRSYLLNRITVRMCSYYEVSFLLIILFVIKNITFVNVIRIIFHTKILQDAVRKLNRLQSNKSTIEQIRKDIRTGQVSASN